MVKVTSLMGLGALFVMETKEGTVLFSKIHWKLLGKGGSFFAVKKACLGEIQRTSALFEFLLFGSSLASRSAGRGCIRFRFFQQWYQQPWESTPHRQCPFECLDLHPWGLHAGTVSGKLPSRMWFSMHL
jgi:hypothetical protein